MRILGFLFVVVLIVAAIGLFQGWFAVHTTHAAGKSGVELEVDKDKMASDTRSAADQIGRLGSKAAEQVKSLAHKVSPQQSELEGNLTSVDAAARNIAVTTANSTIDLHVPVEVPVKRDGMVVGFDELHIGARVRLTMEHSGDDLRLAGIALLP